MDQERERYRMRLQHKWDRRVIKHDNGGRREKDYKSPPFFTLGFIIQLLTLIIGGFVFLVIVGCQSIKKAILGG